MLTAAVVSVLQSTVALVMVLTSALGAMLSFTVMVCTLSLMLTLPQASTTRHVRLMVFVLPQPAVSTSV